LLPVFSNLLEPDAEMAALIAQVRQPFEHALGQVLAVTDDLLYRRGNFNGSFDELILDALQQSLDAEIALSPGFRWGTTLLPGSAITFEDVMAQTAITYPGVTLRSISGAELKSALEDISDNLFNPDPYYRQGGDMVRTGRLTYACNPRAAIGRRIEDMRINSNPVEADKLYRVASWASVTESGLDSTPMWEILKNHLRSKRKVGRVRVNTPMLI